MSTFMVRSATSAPPSLRYFPSSPYKNNPPIIEEWVGGPEFRAMTGRMMVPAARSQYNMMRRGGRR